MYLDMGVLTPSEIRKGLAQEGEYQVEELLGEDDLQDADLWGSEDLPTDPYEPGMKPSGEIGERRAEGDSLNPDRAPVSGGRGEDNKPEHDRSKPLTAEGSRGIINVVNTDADDEWITVNGAPVKVENGELQGEVGEKIANGEDMDYSAINSKINDLKSQGIVNPHIGEAKEAVPVKIASVNKHALKHGVTQAEAQSYIDNAVVMFDQGDRSLYVSGEGNSVILDAEKRLISAYKKADFDPGINAILEVMKNGK